MSTLDPMVEALVTMSETQLHRVMKRMTRHRRRELATRWGLWAHAGQSIADDDWMVWMIQAGRGFGKTRAGSEWVCRHAAERGDLRVALVGATRRDVESVMVGGESGLLSVGRHYGPVRWRPTAGVVEFGSGARAYAYSAEVPDTLRGPQHHLAWCDDGAGGVGELFALRPERVSIEADASGWPVAYRYRVGANVTRIAAQDAGGRPALIHIRAFHPTDDHYGLGCMGAAAGAVAIHNAAARWNKALLDNAARPSGALVHDPGDGGVLSADQFARLRAEMDDAFAGAANAGRPMLLDGALKWQAMSMTPADMDFAGLKAQAAREIALAFGVPPMLLGLPGDNTFANYREANRALWRQAIVPMGNRILTGIQQGLTPWLGEVALAIDQDGVPALGDDRERLWARIGAADFLSVEEKRAMLGV